MNGVILLMKDANSAALCECCGGKDISMVARKRSWFLRLCQNCGLVFVWPQPSIDELKIIYSIEQGYFKTAQANLSDTSPTASINLHNFLQNIGVSSGKLLDVGCSTGKLIFHLRKLGWDVAGCDLNEGALKVAQANGLDVYRGTLDTNYYAPESFDVINMGDVLEHVCSPNEFLNAAYRILRPNGILVIRTPNASCSFATSTLVLARLTGFPWPHSEAPYHLYEFSPKSITTLLKRNSFDLIKIELSGKTPFLYTIGSTGFFDELKKKLKVQGKYKIDKSVIIYIPALIAITIILAPFYIYSRIADRLFHKGHAMNIVARRIY